jgi:hypothetical protein
MTPSQLDTELRAFASHLLSPLLEEGKNPIVKHQVIKDRPLTIRLGMRVTGADPEHLKALASDGKAVREAWLKQWPVNTSGIRDAKSVSIAGDDKHVLMDLIFFTLQIDTPDSLTPAAPAD